MILNCSKEILKKNLIMEIDISNSESWNNNLNFKVESIYNWVNSISNEFTLCDYGLTMFDVGKTIDMNQTILHNKPINFSLEPLGYNSLSGNSVINNTNLPSGVTDPTYGNYFMLSGDTFLNNYFKLQGYDYQVLPVRFNNGFTFETVIKINDNSEGMFLYLGTRSEDKYNPHFSGETQSRIEYTTETVRTGAFGQSLTITGSSTVYEGVSSSIGNILYSLKEDVIRKKAFNDFATATEIELVQVPQLENIKNNAIGFYLSQDKKIGVKYIKSDGNIYNYLSNKSINYSGNTSGWTSISISFQPYDIIDNYNEENALCYPRRLGVLRIFVNGRQYDKIVDFEEFYFLPLQNDDEKVIGVPYNISWGGGSFGLNNSYHYNKIDNYIYSGNNNTYINDNFTIIDYDNACTGTSENTELLNNGEYLVLNYVSGNTCNNYYFQYNNPIELFPNREYKIDVNVTDYLVFQQNSKYNIDLIISGNSSFEIINSSNITEQNRLETISKTIKLSDNCEKAEIIIGILINSTSNLLDYFYINFSNFKINGTFEYIKNDLNHDLTIAKNFNSYYIGGIQKLRLYDIPFNYNIAMNNSIADLNLNNVKGGRLIYVR